MKEIINRSGLIKIKGEIVTGPLRQRNSRQPEQNYIQPDTQMQLNVIWYVLDTYSLKSIRTANRRWLQ